jgi:hypothetical protein
VIRALWSLYRDRGVTRDWKPLQPPQTSVGVTARTLKAREKAEEERGPGVPARPAQWPASHPTLEACLRRMLFEIPPARLPKPRDEDKDILAKLKPMPARKAKLALIEVLRDLALEDVDFALAVVPVMKDFLDSRGQSEMAACLVALARILNAHPQVCWSVRS